MIVWVIKFKRLLSTTKIEDYKKDLAFTSFVFSLCLFFIHCSRHSRQEEHLAHFASIFKKVDTTRIENKDQALQLLDSAFRSFPNPGIFDLYSKDSLKADIYSYAKHDYQKAIAYADSMLLLVGGRTEEEHFAEKYAWALFDKGSFFVNLKDYEQALQYFTLAKEVEVEKVHNKCSLVDCGGYLAKLFQLQGKFREAAGLYLQTYREHVLCGGATYQRLMELQSCLANAGTNYRWAGLEDSAAYYYAMALELIRKNETKFPENYYSTTNAKGVLFEDQAELMVKNPDNEAAELLLKRSIEATRSADIRFTQYTRNTLTRYYLEKGRLSEAASLLAETKKSLDSSANESAQMEWYRLIAEYDKRRNLQKLADENWRRYTVLKDSIDTRTRRFSEKDIEKQFESIKQKYLFETLKRDNQAKKAYLIISVLIILLAIVMIGMIWQNLRHSKTLNRQKQAVNDELQMAFSSLEQSHQENTLLMKVVAHELKNPISAIYNIMSILLKNELSASDRELFTAISASCSDSMITINDLLEKRRGPAGAEREWTYLGMLLRYCVQLQQIKADAKGQRLAIKADDISLFVNRQAIWRVMSNIIYNAIKFSPRNAVIDISLKKHETTILFCVRDHGIGIPDSLSASIFDRPGEQSRTGTAGEPSYGMGLSISKTIIEEHGGRIWFETQQGAGTTFYVELPI
jgi:signal transduction histidine kinase